MAIDNLASNESRLSGAYIRSLVKQLTTSKPLNTNENLINNDSLIVGEFTPQTSINTKKGDKLGMAKPNNNHNQQQGHKKQVRRRLHTSRPYQERLLNMAEARKEIVTALKYHRASMKQARDHKQTRDEQHMDGHQQQLQQQQRSIFGVQDYQTRTLVKNEPSSSLDNNFCYSNNNNNNNCNNYNNYNYSPSYPWEISPTQFIEPLNNIPLPNQTLGLNLNIQAFTNLDTPFCHNTINTTYTNNHYSPLSPSSSSSSTPRDLGATTTAEGAGLLPSNGMDMMHPALDEVEMAAIRSVGEQHQMEWDDTLNLVKSAWWFKYLKTVDFGKEIKREEENYNNNNDHVAFGKLEFPPWLSANSDESLLQQHLDDSCSEDTTLPWMDIGDIDGMDDEWLS